MKFSFCKWLSTGGCFWIRDGWMCLLLLSSLGPPSAAVLCGPYACCHSVCDFICVPALLCLEDLVVLNQSTSYSTGLPNPQGEAFDGGTPFRAECSGVSPLCMLSACFCSHLLQEEASPMMLSKALTYEYSRLSLGVLSLLRSSYRTVLLNSL